MVNPSFCKLPKDVRKTIFELCLIIRIGSRTALGPPDKLLSTPSLLASLRGHQELYREAIEIYYSINTWCLDAGTFVPFSDLGFHALGSICKLHIYLQRIPDPEELEDSSDDDQSDGLGLFIIQEAIEHECDFRAFLVSPEAKLPLVENLKMVDILWDTDETSVAVSFIMSALSNFKRLEHLRFSPCRSAYYEETKDAIEQVNGQRKLEENIDNIQGGWRFSKDIRSTNYGGIWDRKLITSET